MKMMIISRHSYLSRGHARWAGDGALVGEGAADLASCTRAPSAGPGAEGARTHGGETVPSNLA